LRRRGRIWRDLCSQASGLTGTPRLDDEEPRHGQQKRHPDDAHPVTRSVRHSVMLDGGNVIDSNLRSTTIPDASAEPQPPHSPTREMTPETVSPYAPHATQRQTHTPRHDKRRRPPEPTKKPHKPRVSGRKRTKNRKAKLTDRLEVLVPFRRGRTVPDE
jgi:hypothetical protein